MLEITKVVATRFVERSTKPKVVGSSPAGRAYHRDRAAVLATHSIQAQGGFRAILIQSGDDIGYEAAGQ
jgi:hypothetical protein